MDGYAAGLIERYIIATDGPRSALGVEAEHNRTVPRPKSCSPSFRIAKE
ncbi:MAG: hypothetical protein U0791_12445 [Gemmataceae bacterium]